MWEPPGVITSGPGRRRGAELVAAAAFGLLVGLVLAGIGWTRTAGELDRVETELTDLRQSTATDWPVVVRGGVTLQPEDLDPGAGR